MHCTHYSEVDPAEAPAQQHLPLLHPFQLQEKGQTTASTRADKQLSLSSSIANASFKTSGSTTQYKEVAARAIEGALIASSLQRLNSTGKWEALYALVTSDWCLLFYKGPKVLVTVIYRTRNPSAW